MTQTNGLSRRQFMATTAALAGVWMLPKDFLGQVLAAPQLPSEAPTTLQQTIRLGSVLKNKFRVTAAGPGEAYIPRLDLIGKAPAAARLKQRRSLVYLGHLSDNHIIDAQSPGRLEPLVALTATFVDATRPQDTMTVQVLSAMVTSLVDAMESPLTGAPMAAVFNTGDNADSMSALELRWSINTLDGVAVTPNSGAPGVYEGIQVWPESTYAYQPGNPGADEYGTYGFPQLDGVLDAAVSQNVESPGLPVPWYSVYGNHDSLFMGNINPGEMMRQWAQGDSKAATWSGSGFNMLNGWEASTSALQRLVDQVQYQLGLRPGTRKVTPDAKRSMLEQGQFMREHMNTTPLPGPVGHGFTSENLKNGETWWKTDVGPFFRVFGLDSCSQVAGANGAIPEAQFNWLKSELAKATAEKKLCLVNCHHNSLSLDNDAEPTLAAGQRLVHAEEFVEMLLGFPHMIAWFNGHSHRNMIIPHAKSGAGFWEIAAASCVDYPQQQQLLEIVDNRDGTLSIFTTVINHSSPPVWTEGDYSQTGLASLSRQLAGNSWMFEPWTLVGSPLDRNTELLMPAPFDMSQITDAQLEKSHVAQRARLAAYRKGKPA
ncbi:MAG: TIGR03767 family metallophosphoesterase [Candidatus Nanopelagicales bacterium]|nr:TIGR03767 family metallophosphoesterase [Candidatus Nanopelagicales bacterium]